MHDSIKESWKDDSSSKVKPLLLVFPYDIMAHYLRCLQLASYLQPWYTIQFLYSSRYYSFVEEAGYETFECTTLDPVKSQQGVQSFDFSWLNETDLSTIYKAQVKVITELQPAVVIGDMAPTLKMAAEKTGVAYFALLNGYLSRYYAFMRRMPRSHPLYRLFNLLPTTLYRYLICKGERMYFEKIHQPFKEIRKREGLSQRSSYVEELEGDLNLICDLPEIFPQVNLPRNYIFISPLLNPPSIKDIGICSQLDPDKKTLLISMGSTGNWKNASFLNRPEYNKYNIVTAGDHEGVIQGANVFAYGFINNSRFFERVDLVICHGGNGTCYQALSYGIPVLCLSTHFEQEYNIEGLERNGLVKSLNDVSSQDYILLIEHWMRQKGNKTFKAIQERIAEATHSCKETIHEIVRAAQRYKQPVFDTTVVEPEVQTTPKP